MDIGVVLQCTPPAARVVDLARRAETYGFTYVWTFDSHILWEEPYVIYSKILDETRKVIVGPMVTNPATRDITVTASVFATLNEMYGNRTVIGIGRGDSAVRVTNGKPVSVAELRQAVIDIKGLVNGEADRVQGQPHPPALGRGQPHRRLGGRLRAQGARPHRRGWRWLHLAVGRSIHRRMDDQGRPRCRGGRRARSRRRLHLRRCPRLHHRRIQGATRPRRATNCVGSAAWSATTWRTSSTRYGDSGAVPQALTDYIKNRQGYDYNQHGQAGNTHTDFVPDEIVDRFCIIGTPEEHIRSPRGTQGPGRTNQFAVYLQHDNKDAHPRRLRREGDSGHPGDGARQVLTPVGQ